MTKTICGVDVSSTSLDARIGRDAGPWERFHRNDGGIAAMVAFCRDHAVDLVVMEATGGYERLPFGLLWAADMPTAVVNPRSVRRFAESLPLRRRGRWGCWRRPTALMPASSLGKPRSSTSKPIRRPARRPSSLSPGICSWKTATPWWWMPD